LYQCILFANSSHEFSRTYIQIQEELKIHIQDLKTNIQIEADNVNKFDRLMKEHRNEIFNRNGICSNSKLVIEIENMKFLDYNPSMKSLFVKVKVGNTVQITSAKNINNPVYEEAFEL
jgi:hypothetical protein